MSQNDVTLILVTVPDKATGELIARDLVENRLAACVNIVPGLISIYRWQGKIEREAELLLLVKSRRSRFKVVTERVKSLHPYSLPEVIALDVSEGLPPYLEWVVQSTEAESTDA